MIYSNAALNLIIKSRPLHLQKNKLWNGRHTIGYCHIIKVGDKLKDIDKISKKEAKLLLEKSLLKISKQLDKAIEVNVNQNQFDALVSLVYDVGIRSVISSGMIDQLNKGKILETSVMFRKWSRYKKRPVYQLIKARQMEMKLFDTPVGNEHG